MGKAAKKPMTKSEIAKAIAEEHELKTSTAGKIMNSLAEIVSKEVKLAGKVTFPGGAMIKTRFKPATKAYEKEIFGKMQDADGQGETSTHDREGFPRCGFEEECVRLIPH